MTTAAQQADLNRLESGNALLGFLIVDHEAFATPQRVVTDVLDYVWKGETYTAATFGYRLIDDGDGDPRSIITIPNVDAEFGRAIEKAPSRAKIELHILSSADFDLSVDPREQIGTPVPLYSLTEFETVEATVDDISAEVTIEIRDYAQEPWPVTRATADRLPGVFR
ncbi:hypothetical protein HKCCE4037_06400 [Rhodobacterales bacterium HKCCE4037]|nr:hypothetical protein [Rhodobacterales bacterium HKCCE4037]